MTNYILLKISVITFSKLYSEINPASKIGTMWSQLTTSEIVTINLIAQKVLKLKSIPRTIVQTLMPSEVDIITIERYTAPQYPKFATEKNPYTFGIHSSEG